MGYENGVKKLVLGLFGGLARGLEKRVFFFKKTKDLFCF